MLDPLFTLRHSSNMIMIVGFRLGDDGNEGRKEEMVSVLLPKEEVGRSPIVYCTHITLEVG
jgi:hypothetical protein